MSAKRAAAAAPSAAMLPAKAAPRSSARVPLFLFGAPRHARRRARCACSSSIPLLGPRGARLAQRWARRRTASSPGLGAALTHAARPLARAHRGALERRARGGRPRAAARRVGGRSGRRSSASSRRSAAGSSACTSSISRPTSACATPSSTRAAYGARAPRARSARALRLRPAGALPRRARARRRGRVRAHRGPRLLRDRAAARRRCPRRARASLRRRRRPGSCTPSPARAARGIEPKPDDAPPAPPRQPVGLRARRPPPRGRARAGARAPLRRAGDPAAHFVPHSGPVRARHPPDGGACRSRARSTPTRARRRLRGGLRRRALRRGARRGRARPALGRGLEPRVARRQSCAATVLHVLLDARQPDQGRRRTGAAVPEPDARTCPRPRDCRAPEWGCADEACKSSTSTRACRSTSSRAEGCELVLRDGRRVLDLYGGHCVNTLGAGDPALGAVIAEPVAASSPSPPTCSTTRRAPRVPGGLRGAPAAARRRRVARLLHRTAAPRPTRTRSSWRSLATGRRKVLVFSGAFHGRTAGAAALTDGSHAFPAPPFDVVRVPFGDAAAAHPRDRRQRRGRDARARSSRWPA